MRRLAPLFILLLAACSNSWGYEANVITPGTGEDKTKVPECVQVQRWERHRDGFLWLDDRKLIYPAGLYCRVPEPKAGG